MKKARLWCGIGIAGILLLLALFGLRQYAIYDLTRGDTQAALSRAKAATEQTPSSAPKADSLRTADISKRNNQPIIAKIRKIYRAPTIRESINALTNSDDPLIWVRDRDWAILCMSPQVGPPMTPDTFAHGDYAEAKRIEMATSHNTMRESVPLRLQFPEPWAGIINQLAFASASTFDSDLKKALDIAVIAPMSVLEADTRTTLINVLRRDCDGNVLNKDQLARSRQARAQWAARGATSALYQNGDYGWSSKSLRELTDRDYALVERMILERQPDGLARLLQTTALTSVFETSAIEQNSSVLMALTAPLLVTALATCKLELNDCSSDSPQFKTLCITNGGCDQPDIPTLLRYVSARDGFDPNWLNQQAETLIKKIHEGDLAALGIHRKK
jgi:hypothetical protein